MTIPKLSVWVTVGQRDHVRTCLPSFLNQCRYPNIEYLFALYLPEDPNGNRAWVESLDCPNKRIFDVNDKTLGQTYKMLLAESADYFLNIGDDWWFGCDPTDIITDAIELIRLIPRLCAVRITSHAIPVLDVLDPRFMPVMTKVGPIVVGFSIADTQHVSQTEAFRKAKGLYDETGDDPRSASVPQPLLDAGYDGATILSYWGVSVHAGTNGEDGTITRENRLNTQEAKFIRRRGLFGRRPRSTLYNTGLDAEMRRFLVDPLLLTIARPLVPEAVPVTSQDRLGPCEGRRVA